MSARAAAEGLFGEEEKQTGAVREFPWRSGPVYANNLGDRGARLSDFWDPDMIRAIEMAYRAAQNSSAKAGVGFHLTTSELLYLMRRSLGRCEVSGVRFNGDNFSDSRRRPFVPSIDRIQAKEPYSLDNCRLVAWIVNLSISDWGEDTFWVMVKAASKRGRYAAEVEDPDRINKEADKVLARLARK